MDYGARYLLAWLGVALLAWCLRYFAKDPWHKSLGYAIMTWPVWLSFWSFFPNIQTVLDTGSVLRPYTEAQLDSIIFRGGTRKLLYPAAGLVIYTQAWKAGSWREWMQKIPHIPMGCWTKTEAQSAKAGLIMFPVFLAVSAGINWLVYQAPLLATGDESSVWANMTPLRNIGISLQAAIGEEILYRAVLLVGLLRFFHPWAAITIQGVIFGIAHSGYGTIAHILVPLAFGLFSGWIVFYTGFWSAVILHFLIDVYAFGADTARNAPWFEGVLLIGIAIMSAITLSFVTKWAFSRWTPKKA